MINPHPIECEGHSAEPQAPTVGEAVPTADVNDTPEEALISQALIDAGIAFERGVKNLDFYLPDYDLHIESKGGGCKPNTQGGEKVLKQLSRADNVVLVKGYEGTKSFLRLIAKHRVGQAAPYGAESVVRDELNHLINAVTYADPPKMFNGVLCHEARVPIEFVENARKALAQPQAGEEVARTPSVQAAIDGAILTLAKHDAKTNDLQHRLERSEKVDIQLALHLVPNAHGQGVLTILLAYINQLERAALTKDSPAPEPSTRIVLEGDDAKEFAQSLENPARVNPKLAELFSRPEPTPAQDDAAGIVRELVRLVTEIDKKVVFENEGFDRSFNEDLEAEVAKATAYLNQQGSN
ncbi:hypothetical protein U8C35_06385 [Sinorhizobium medicae]|uniref:hypothetical protein n=1 Tax=Sinorhizobium medicae TaxID=110321 RepID=UPI002AF6B36F|nr:hypothetical protein [Sinorhizobium medicae]WQO60060.1 hypothetical protein U8C35_06385 [Sinorhizobium medicae]